MLVYWIGMLAIFGLALMLGNPCVALPTPSYTWPIRGGHIGRPHALLARILPCISRAVPTRCRCCRLSLRSYSVLYGKDYGGFRCGVEGEGVPSIATSKVFYPQLSADLARQSSLVNTPWKVCLWLCHRSSPTPPATGVLRHWPCSRALGVRFALAALFLPHGAHWRRACTPTMPTKIDARNRRLRSCTSTASA